MALTLGGFYLPSASGLVSQPFFLLSICVFHSFFAILRPTLTGHKPVFAIQVCNYLLNFNIWKILR